MPRLLFADDRGVVYDHPTLRAAVRTGEALLAPPERPVALPEGAALAFLPGRRPVGVHPGDGALVVLDEVRVGRRRIVPHAVGATLPPGWTRTFLPAAARPALRVVGTPPVLPQWAYTAAALGPEGPVAWALRTDRRAHWDVRSHSTPELPGLVARMLASSANPVYRQLSRCALEWRCFTAQNTFYGRDEGAIPSSAACNAACVGCLSESEPGLPPSSHERIARPPTAGEMAEVAVRHLETATGRVMVSFGQGCEGEPLLRWREIERALRMVRAQTSRGSLHANTNGSLPEALGRLVEAGLDSVRISTNSASPDLYRAWYRPRGYGLAEVERSIRVAKRKGAYVALNLLTFPGVTDREGEVERLAALVRRTAVDQVQTRPLAIDPDLYLEIARGRGAGGSPIGIGRLVRELRRARPGLVVGNFSRARGERKGAGRGRRARAGERAAAGAGNAAGRPRRAAR
jgi:pyruvate-formate lyase-activating enzyme